MEPAAVEAPRRSLMPIVLALAVGLGGFFLLRSRLAPPPTPGIAAGHKADLSWKVVTPAGAPADLVAYKGRPIFLNVWATWCGPCVQELPSIDRLARDPRVAGVAFVCISVDADPADARRFLSTRDLKPDFLVAAGSPPPVFATDGIPATFLIDADGTIVESTIGSAEWDDPKVVDKLAALAKRQ